MMFYLYVQQNRWITVTLLAGTGLMILFWLTYRAMWRPRGQEQEAESVQVTGMMSFLAWILGFVPMVLIVLVCLVTAYSVTHLIWASNRIPNW